MQEMAYPGEIEGDPVLVRRLDHFVVADTAAGFDNGPYASLGRRVHAVAEGEEGFAISSAFFRAHRAASTREVIPMPTATMAEFLT